MTTPNIFARTAEVPNSFVFPDPPEREPDDMTSFDRLAANGNAYLLAQYLWNPETTLVGGEHYISTVPVEDLTGVRYPDLFVAFDVYPAAYRRSNAYIISEQGKPPDFVLEIASRRTGGEDTGPKLRDYAALGIREYWRFDETGRYHGTRLAGERLVDGEYVAIDIEELPGGNLQGYSTALDLHLRWEAGELVFYNPATGRPIATLADERARADTAETRADTAETRADAAEAERNAEQEARTVAEARANAEQTRADAAEARVRELEKLLRRQNP